MAKKKKNRADPPPLSFHVEKNNSKKDSESSEEQIRRDIREKLIKFAGLPQETNSNSMATMSSDVKFVWRPNNYRRQLRVKTKSNSTIENIRTTIDVTRKEETLFRRQIVGNSAPKKLTTTIDSTIKRKNFSVSSHTKIVSIKSYHPQITIQYGKNILSAIWYQNIIDGEKETFLIHTNTLKECDERINQRRDSIKEMMDIALFDFAKRFNIIIPHEESGWAGRYENWIHGIDYIDKIPSHVMIHDTYFKKVYDEGIELINTGKKDEDPVATLKNTITNLAIKNISPEIAGELVVIKELVKANIDMTNSGNKLTKQGHNLSLDILKINKSSAEAFSSFTRGAVPTLNDFAINIKTHNKVLQGIDKSFRKFNKMLSASKQTKLGDF